MSRKKCIVFLMSHLTAAADPVAMRKAYNKMSARKLRESCEWRKKENRENEERNREELGYIREIMTRVEKNAGAGERGGLLRTLRHGPPLPGLSFLSLRF